MKTTSKNSPATFMITTGNWNEGNLVPPTFVKWQSDSLRAAGYDVFLTIVDDRTSVRGIYRNVRRLRREIREYQPTVIHAQYGSVTAAIANFIKGSTPLIVSFCGDDLLGTPIPGFVWRIRESSSRAMGLWAARRAAAVIVKSQNLFQALPSDLQHKATVLPNGIDTSFFRPLNQDDCRAQLCWDRNSKIVLFGGSWNGQSEDQARKNPALARAAIDVLNEKTTSHVELKTMCNVPHKNIPLMMNAADCLLVTSLQEGSPNIVKEAMACNLPVVSVPCGDVVERLTGIHPGAIRPYQPASLAEAVQEVLVSARRSNGREHLFGQGLTTTKVAAELLEIYRRAELKLSALSHDQQQNQCAV